MSQEVDSRVVEMRFDNANFEKNTKKTISSIDRLMEKLQLKGAEKGFEKLDAAAEDVDFATMSRSLDTLESKFSALNIVATTALVNITNKFADAGEKLVKSLSVDQVMSGWNKYTEKTGNVQTIMNATGKSIDQVNGYLNKLMWYSDETSFSFNEMTSAMSQAAASGGDIEKMIPMIMGIANATADAGKSGLAFQSTIRNLIQSYSAGYLQLQDWKSLNLMGTATKALKQELIDTAVEMGVLKEGEVTIANFESTLSKKWANTTVMEKTFAKYAAMTQDIYDAVQSGEYDTASEAIDALSGSYDTLAERSFKAAQQAKSFNEAIDATKDAVSSSWMKVFETLFGNKEEATETWTELSERLYDIFVPGIEALNDRLKEGLNSGWKQLNDRFGDQADTYTTILKQVALASGLVTEEQIADAGSFDKALQKNGVSAELLQAGLEEAQASAEKLLALSDDELKKQGFVDRETIQRDADAFASLNEEIQNGTLFLGDYAQKMSELSGREHLMQSLWNIMDAIGKVIAPVKEAFSEIFPPADGERIYSIAERLDLLTQKLIISDQTAAKIKETFVGVFRAIKPFVTLIGKIGDVAKEAFSLLVNAAEPVGQVLLNIGAGLGDFVTAISEAVTGSGTLREKLKSTETAVKKLLSPVEDLGGLLKKTKIGEAVTELIQKGEESTGILGVLYSTGKRVFSFLSDLIGTTAAGGAGILQTLGMAISTVVGKLGRLGETIVSALGLTKPTLEDFQQSLVDMPKNLNKSMTEFAAGFQRSMNKINGSVGDAFAPVKQFFVALKEGFDAINGTDIYRFLSLLDVGLLAYTIGQLAKATKSLKTMLETPLTGVLNSISGTFKQLTSAIKTWQKNENSQVLLKMAEAVLVLAGAMWVMSRIDPDRFGVVVAATLGSIVLLAGVAKLLEPTAKKFDKALDSLKASFLNAATLWGTAAALVGLGVAVGSIAKGLSQLVAAMNDGDLKANALALAIGAASISMLMIAMGKLTAAMVVGEKIIGHKVILALSVELIALGGALKIMAEAVDTLSQVKFSSMVKATGDIFALGVLVTTMASVLNIVNRFAGVSGFQNGAAVAAMAGGIWIISQAVIGLAAIPMEQLEAGMTAIKTAMLMLTVMAGLSKNTHFGSGAAVLMMSSSLIVLAGAVGVFAVMGDAAITGLEKVAIGLTALSTASRIAGADGATAILTMSSAMIILAGAVAIYTKLGVNAWTGLVRCAAALGEMMAAVWLLSRMKGDALQAAWVVNTLSGGMIKLAAACAIFNRCDWKALGVAGIALTGLIAVLFGAGWLATKLPVLSVGFTALGTAFDKFASGALKLAGATAIIGVLSFFAGPICTAIVNAAPDIGDALTAIITMICDVLMKSAVPIATALVYTGTVVIATIGMMLGLINQETYEQLTGNWDSLCQWFEEHSLGDLIAGWFQSAADAVKTKLDELGIFSWDNLFSEASGNWGAGLAKMMQAIDSKLGTNFYQDTVKAWLGDGVDFQKAGEQNSVQFVAGSVKGINDNKSEAEEAGKELANSVDEGVKSAAEIGSPSKVMAENGRWIVLGLVEGIGDQSALAQAKNAMLGVAASIRNVFTTFWGIHSPSDLAATDAENILEGAILGIADEQKREELRQSAYDSTLAVKDGVSAALDEATEAMQTGMTQLYDSFKQTSLHPGNLLYQNGYNVIKDDVNQLMQDNVLIPTNEGFKKPGNKTPSGWEQIKEYAEKGIGKLNETIGAFTDPWKAQVDEALDNMTSSASSSASKSGKSLADTLASEFSDQLKANKSEMTAASNEYALWEVTGGDTAALEELVRKKTESLTKEIELQTSRVAIAQDQYDTLLARVGGDNEKTKDAYATLLSEQKTLAELRRDKQDSILSVIKERYESDTKTAEDEYNLWTSLYEDSATVTEQSNRKIDYINRKIKAQAEILLATEADYKAVKEEFGEASQKTQAAYQQYLEAKADQQELINTLNKTQIEAFDNEVAYLEKQEKLITNRQTMLAKIYGDGDLSGRADAYTAAVEQYGEGSAEARRAATQGTMTAIIGVGTALDSMRYSLQKVTSKQLKYDEAVKKFGKNSETALEALADLQDEQYDFVGFAEDLADAFEMDDVGKRAMMQLGNAISKNWKPIQNGFNQVWSRVKQSFPEEAEKLAKAFGLSTKEGFTETATDLMSVITAALNGDWATVVTGGISTILDFVGSEFGQSSLSELVNLLAKLPAAFSTLSAGGQTVSVMGQMVQVSGEAEGLVSIFTNLGQLLGGTGGSGLVGLATDGIGAISEALGGSGGLGAILGDLGGTLVQVLGSLGPEGLLVGAAIVGGVLLIANWDKVCDFLQDAFTWIGDAVTNLWNNFSEFCDQAAEIAGQFAKGLWDGLTAGARAIWDGVTGLGSAIVDGFKNIFGIHSPSTVMAELGGYMSLGFAEGIQTQADAVGRSVEDVSDSALTMMRQVVENAAEIAADDTPYTPTIRPVMDMSDVQNGADWINANAFPDGTIGLNVDRTAGLAQSMTQTAAAQRAQRDDREDDRRTEHTNQDVVDAVGALGERIDGVAKAVAGMKVQINGRKFVGEIATDMDEELGKRAARRR